MCLNLTKSLVVMMMMMMMIIIIMTINNKQQTWPAMNCVASDIPTGKDISNQPIKE
jgi:hypothetical protein